MGRELPGPGMRPGGLGQRCPCAAVRGGRGRSFLPAPPSGQDPQPLPLPPLEASSWASGGPPPTASSPPALRPGCIFIYHRTDLPQLGPTVSQPHELSDFLLRQKLFLSKDAVFVAHISQVPRVPGRRRQETSDLGKERGQLPSQGNVTLPGRTLPSGSSAPSCRRASRMPEAILMSSACEVPQEPRPGSVSGVPAAQATPLPSKLRCVTLTVNGFSVLRAQRCLKL